MTAIDKPTIDVARLRKELEYVTANRHQWSQGTWLTRTTCGTVGCLAGNTVLNAGYRPVYRPGVCHTTEVEVGDGVEHVKHVATELLGLTREQSRQLFFVGNSLYRLWHLASRFTDGEIQVAPDVEPTVADRFTIYVDVP